jgi:hypothetical protein
MCLPVYEAISLPPLSNVYFNSELLKCNFEILSLSDRIFMGSVAK